MNPLIICLLFTYYCVQCEVEKIKALELNELSEGNATEGILKLNPHIHYHPVILFLVVFRKP